MTYEAKRPDASYLRKDWNAGDRDVLIECHRQWISRNAKEHKCVGNGADSAHRVPAGERMLVQSAKVEGHWCGYRLCLACCDKWLDHLDGVDGGGA